MEAEQVNRRRTRLVEFLRGLPAHIRDHLEKHKRDGEAHRLRPDWLWYSLVTSFSTMGNSRGYAALMADPDNLASLSFEALARVQRGARRSAIERSLRRAKVRMPSRKAEWLENNFVKVVEMGGVSEANRLAFATRGAEEKMAFLQRFDGVGEKYSRNIWMDIYDPDFHSSIAVDQRIKNVSSALGLTFKNYREHEKFYCDLAAEAGLQPWELDRVMYWFLPIVLGEIARESIEVHSKEIKNVGVVGSPNHTDVKWIIKTLGLVPLTIEGGYFRETYRAPLEIASGALPNEYGGDRNASTCIYYLLAPETFSAIHRVKSDEIFHFYAGDAVEMLQVWPSGEAKVIVIHNDLSENREPQVVVPAGVWQGCRLIPGGSWALMGCTVAPGFDYADFELADREELLTLYPEYSVLITALTASDN